MKKSIILLGTVALAALAACSADETVDSAPVNPDVLSFSVIQNNISRAADIYTSTSMPETFNVIAKTASDNVDYFKDAVTKSTTNTSGADYAISGGSVYWPASDNLDVFAFRAYTGGTTSAAEFAVSSSSVSGDKTTGITIAGVQIPYENTAQHDLIYASALNAAKGSDGKVSLQFNHALAQLAFKAKNESRGIYVEIGGVYIGFVKNKGNLTFGKSGQTGCSWSNLENTDASGGVMSWSFMRNLASPVVLYPEWDSSTQTVSEMTPVDICSTNNDGIMYVIPQTITKWDPSGWTGSQTASEHARADYSTLLYLILKVRNVADMYAGVQSSDIYIYGTSTGFGTISIPIPVDQVSAWEAGKKYTYTFVIGRDGTNGGYNSNDASTALIPVSVATTVSDFTDGNSTNFAMNK